jgi:hypothetical protein
MMVLEPSGGAALWQLHLDWCSKLKTFERSNFSQICRMLGTDEVVEASVR